MGSSFTRTDVVVWLGQKVLDHFALEPHPPWQGLQQTFVDAVLSNLLANHSRFLFLVRTFHGEVVITACSQSTVDHVPSDVRCDGAA